MSLDNNETKGLGSFRCSQSSWGRLRLLFLGLFLLAIGWDSLDQVVTWKRIGRLGGDRNHFRIRAGPWSEHPRTLWLDQTTSNTKERSRHVEPMSTFCYPGEDYYAVEPLIRHAVPRDHDSDKSGGKCVPAAKWQMSFYPTCNSFHELEFGFHTNGNSTVAPPTNHEKHADHRNLETQRHELEHMELLGLGTSRDAWKLTKYSDMLVLKTLKIKSVDFSPELYHHQRIDAVASERLSSSPNVLDIYGFCGVAVLNEFGQELKARKLTTLERLRYSRDLAGGIADTHNIDNSPNAMVAHADLRVSNTMFSYDMKSLKIGDFNQAFLLGKNKKTKKACGYDLNFPFWNDRFAAPEECFIATKTEETDVYHMGGMLYFLLTGKKPYRYNTEDFENRKETWSNEKKWVMPTLPDDVLQNRNPGVVALRETMEACLRFEKEDRAKAKEIYVMLNKAYKKAKKRANNEA